MNLESANSFPLPLVTFALMKTTITFLALIFSTAVFASAQGLPRVVDSDIHAALQSVPLSMLFSGESAEYAKQWRDRFRSQLDILLGESTPPTEWKAIEEERTEFEDQLALFSSEPRVLTLDTIT